jgi:hypothetical protein
MGSRFLEFYLKDCSLEEFNMITTILLHIDLIEQKNLPKISSSSIKYDELKGYKRCNKVARLSRNENDIDWIIEAIQDYSKEE